MTDPRAGWRLFLAGPKEITVHEVSPAVDQAMDVLNAAGMLNEKSVPLVHAAEKDGRDPVQFAHHLVSLAAAVQR